MLKFGAAPNDKSMTRLSHRFRPQPRCFVSITIFSNLDIVLCPAGLEQANREVIQGK